MCKIKLLAILMFAGTLAACGSSGSGSSSGGSSSGPNIPPPPPPEEGTQIEIQGETLPLMEDFNVVDAVDFFSVDYKALNTPAVNTIVDDDGNEFDLEDPHPSFYYPSCCFWEEDPDTGQLTGEIDPEFVNSWKAENGRLALIDSARLTIGQILSDLTDENATDRKSDTSDGAEGASAELGSWGELDLSQPYRVSFCLNDNGPFGSGFSNLEVFVDNNSGGRQDESIWTSASLLLRTGIDTLESGNRVVVDVPGNAVLLDDGGNQVGEVLAVNEALDGDSMPTGTSTSFLQFRVSSGGYAVISDLVVEHQEGGFVDYPACAAETGFVEPPDAQGVPFQGLPLEVDLGMTFEQFFGEEDTFFLAFPDDRSVPFYTPRAGSSRMFIDDQAETITWGDGRFYIGHREGTKLDAVGGIDLSEPYRISFDVVKANPAGGNVMIYLDNTESGVGNFNSIHEEDTTIWSTTLDQLEDGQSVVIEPDTLGTTTSFLQFRCDSGCGQPDGPESELGITITNIVIESLSGGSGGDEEWTPQNLSLAGDADPQADGSISVNMPTEVTITATGGNLDSSTFDAFFAHKQIDYSEFVMTARIDSVDGAAGVDGGNTKRFGMMVIEDLTPVGDNFGNLSAWADIGLYAGDTGLQGSRANQKGDGSRTRSNIDVEVGDWVRIVIANEGEDDKRVTWYTSSNGSDFAEAGTKVSPNDFPAGFAESWFVGFYGAPGGDEVTMSFSDISVEPIGLSAWTPQNLNLAGDSEFDAMGSLDEAGQTSATITATGGSLNSSSHMLFFAHQQADISDFVFSARIASVTGADIAEDNDNRFGLMVMDSLAPAGNTYANLGAWADIGFYANGDPVELIGSRANNKSDGSRTRSNIGDLSVGDYVRIEVYDDGADKRVRRCYSADGVTWTQANSTTDFQASAESDSWYYGFYGAPGENEVTVEFDNVVFEEYTADCDA